jgi:hypothetical protein
MKRYMALILLFTTLSFIYGSVAKTLIEEYAAEEDLKGFCSTTALFTKSEILKVSFPFKRIVSAFGEDFKYKIFPLLLISIILMLIGRVRTELVKNNKQTRVIIFFVLFCTTIVGTVFFGLIHGNFLNVFAQGFSGLIQSLLVLLIIDDSLRFKKSPLEHGIKFNPYRIFYGLLAGYLALVTSHSLFNLTIFYWKALS